MLNDYYFCLHTKISTVIIIPQNRTIKIVSSSFSKSYYLVRVTPVVGPAARTIFIFFFGSFPDVMILRTSPDKCNSFILNFVIVFEYSIKIAILTFNNASDHFIVCR